MDSSICPNCGRLVNPSVAEGLCLRCLAANSTTQDLDPPPEILATNSPLPPGSIRVFGDFELSEEISRGSMGVVYRARQISLKREVAIKVILHSPFADEAFLRRFQEEAKIVASLQHPHIVPVHGTGEYFGQPYFVMEFIRGKKTLADFRGTETLSWEKAAETVRVVAETVQHVHDCGIFHRDLKPTNVLVDERGRLLLTDFGVAKRLDDQNPLTITGQVLGTPAYTAPEQLAGTMSAPTNRSDIYSLGAVLYYLLAGSAPFSGDSVPQLLANVASVEPVPPRRLKPKVPEELEIICLKCLAKAPADRYDSARELAEDLGLWLKGLPIKARRTSWRKRQMMRARRNPVVSALCALLTIIMLAAAVGVTLEWRRAEHARASLIQTTMRIQALQAEELFKIDKASGKGKPYEALATLAANLRLDLSDSTAGERLRSALENHPLAQVASAPFEDGSSLYSMVMTPDASRVVVAGMRNTLRFWNAQTGTPLGSPIIFSNGVLQESVSTNGKVAIAMTSAGEVVVWNADAGGRISSYSFPGASEAMELSPDGSLFVVGFTNGDVAAIDRKPGGRQVRWRAHNDAVQWFQFTPGNRYLITAASDHTAKIWEATNAFKLACTLNESAEVGVAAISPDATRIMTFPDKAFPGLWEFPSGRLIARLEVTNISGGTFSPDSSRIAVATEDAPVYLFDAKTGQKLFAYNGHPGYIMACAFSPDGQRVATGGRDATVQIWDVHSGREVIEPIRHKDILSVIQFDETGQYLLTGGPGDAPALWDVRPRRVWPLRKRAPGSTFVCSWGPGRDEFFTVEQSGAIRVWDAKALAVKRTIVNSIDGGAESFITNSAWTRAVISAGTNMTLVDLSSGSITAIHPPVDKAWRALQFSPDGSAVLVTTGNEWAEIDPGSGKFTLGPVACTSSAERFGHVLVSGAYSPDGRLILTGCYELHARLWDAHTGALVADLPLDGPGVAADFSRDGRSILTRALDSTVRIWSLAAPAAPRLTLRHRDAVTAAVASPDGRVLATGDLKGYAFLWDAVTGARIGAPMLHGEGAFPVEFSSDGRQLLTLSTVLNARRWDARTGLPMNDPLPVARIIGSPDWSTFVSAHAMDDVSVWHETQPPGPAPGWLPALAEGVAGIRYRENGTELLTPAAEILALRKQLRDADRENPWNRWARWFLSDPSTRTISWSSDVMMSDYIKRMAAEDRLGELRELLAAAPTNGFLLAKIARLTVDETNNPCRFSEADFLSRRALQYAPRDKDAARLRAEVVSLLPSK